MTIPELEEQLRLRVAQIREQAARIGELEKQIEQRVISDKTLLSVNFCSRFERLASTLMMTPRRFAPVSVLLVRACFRAIASERA